MSLLIKGMEMPKKCTACEFYYVDFSDGETACLATGCEVTLGECRDINCPLVEIPTPHGRLIDADRLIAVIKSAAGDQISVPISAVLDSIEHAPTVVEEEK